MTCEIAIMDFHQLGPKEHKHESKGRAPARIDTPWSERRRGRRSSWHGGQRSRCRRMRAPAGKTRDSAAAAAAAAAVAARLHTSWDLGERRRAQSRDNNVWAVVQG